MAGDSVQTERPLSRDSTCPWSTSATLPVSPEAEDEQIVQEDGAVVNTRAANTSPTPWSTSATLPVPQEPESHEIPSDTKATESKLATTPKSEKKTSFSVAKHKTTFIHFLRIFSYSTWADKLLIFVAAIASICTGVTLPLMNVVFGE